MGRIKKKYKDLTVLLTLDEIESMEKIKSENPSSFKEYLANRFEFFFEQYRTVDLSNDSDLYPYIIPFATCFISRIRKRGYNGPISPFVSSYIRYIIKDFKRFQQLEKGMENI